MMAMECPMCDGKLKKGRSRFSYHDIEFGEYDADICAKCGEVFFTEEASDEIDRKAKELGLWGLEARSKVSYSGNSLMVRIPREIAEFMDLEKGDGIRIHPEGKKRLVVELTD
jgi:YgiT-type zinc finger domain-containing protein